MKNLLTFTRFKNDRINEYINYDKECLETVTDILFFIIYNFQFD